MLDFIYNNIIVIFVIAIIIIALCLLIYNNRKGIISKAALYAVAKAEQAWGSKTGKIKFAEVYAYLKNKYPVVTFFISEKKLSDIIEKALQTLKEVLSERKEQ